MADGKVNNSSDSLYPELWTFENLNLRDENVNAFLVIFLIQMKGCERFVSLVKGQHSFFGGGGCLLMENASK